MGQIHNTCRKKRCPHCTTRRVLLLVLWHSLSKTTAKNTLETSSGVVAAAAEHVAKSESTGMRHSSWEGILAVTLVVVAVVFVAAVLSVILMGGGS